MTDNSNHDLKILLEEMRINMQQTFATGDTLDQKINAILATYGLILALTSTLQISLSDEQSNWYWLVFIFALFVCVVSAGMILREMAPREYNLAVKSDWNEFEQNFFDKQEKELLKQLLSNYVAYIMKNRENNHRKVRVYRQALIMLSIAVALFLLLLPISIYIS